MIWSLRKEVNSLSLKIVLEKSILGHRNLACAWVLIYHTHQKENSSQNTYWLHKLVEFLNENCGIPQKKKQRETSRKVTSLEQRPQSFWIAQGNPKDLRRSQHGERPPPSQLCYAQGWMLLHGFWNLCSLKMQPRQWTCLFWRTRKRWRTKPTTHSGWN